MAHQLDTDTERFLVVVARNEFLRLTRERQDKKVLNTQESYVKNLQVIDDYVTRLKNKNTQTGWCFSLPEFDLKKGRITKEYGVKNQVVSEYSLNPLPQLPRMCMWAPIRRNFSVDEEKVLHHVPYIGDEVVNDEDWQNELLEFYENRVHLPADDFLADDILADLVDVMVSKVWSEENTTLPKNQKAPAQPIVVDKELAFELISSYIANLAFSPEDLKEKYEFYQQTKSGNIQKETIPNMDGNITSVYSREKALNSFQDIFCRRCFIYDCNAHERIINENYPPIYKPKEENFSCTKPCGEDCFINIESESIQEFISSSRYSQNEYPKLSLADIKTDLTCSEKTLFNVLVRTFQLNFCSIARTIGSKTCAEVYKHFDDLKKEEKEAIIKMITDDQKLIEANKITKHKKKKASSIWTKHYQKFQEVTNAHENYMPCNHEGLPCSKEIADKCECFRRGTFCEKACNCNPNCENRFPGCKCKGACNTKQCSCYYASRECDPDLCKTCGAAELDLLEHRDIFKCNNVSMQRGFYKHLLLGPSEVSGWGVFLNGFATKGELISEYCGETITKDETERRGAVYDKDKTSYMFELNNEQDVDAKRQGNKIRFANHSVNANCKPTVKMVNGDFRIGIYASQNIDKYEELFFDYRYKLNDRLKFVSIERPINKNFTG